MSVPLGLTGELGCLPVGEIQNINKEQKMNNTAKATPIQYVMKAKKVAIFVDWDNLMCEIANMQERIPEIRSFDYNKMDNIEALLHAAINNEQEELYRIFFYTAKPKNGKDLKEWETQHERNVRVKEMIEALWEKDYCAVRLGDMKKIGNGFQQKGTDMLLGLDIAHVTYQHLADTIIVFSKDSDMVPALKCARTNGLHVILIDIVEGKERVSTRLRKHADNVRKINLSEIINDKKSKEGQ